MLAAGRDLPRSCVHLLLLLLGLLLPGLGLAAGATLARRYLQVRHWPQPPGRLHLHHTQPLLLTSRCRVRQGAARVMNMCMGRQ